MIREITFAQGLGQFRDRVRYFEVKTISGSLTWEPSLIAKDLLWECALNLLPSEILSNWVSPSSINVSCIIFQPIIVNWSPCWGICFSIGSLPRVDSFLFIMLSSLSSIAIFKMKWFWYDENRYNSPVMCVRSCVEWFFCCEKIFFHDEKWNTTWERQWAKGGNWYRSRVQSIKSETRRTRFFICWEVFSFVLYSKQKNSFTVSFCSGYSFGRGLLIGNTESEKWAQGFETADIRWWSTRAPLLKHHFSNSQQPNAVSGLLNL